MFILYVLACGDAPPVSHSSMVPGAGSVALAPVPEVDALLVGIEFGAVAPEEIVVEMGEPEAPEVSEDGAGDEVAQGVVESAFDLVSQVGSRFKPELPEPVEKMVESAKAVTEAPAPEIPDVAVAVALPSKPEVDDGLSVEQVVRRYSSQTQYCHHAAAERWSQVEGRVEVAWTIVDGQVQDVEIIDDTTGDPAMASCVARKVKYWRFPASMNTEISHPFVFDRLD